MKFILSTLLIVFSALAFTSCVSLSKDPARLVYQQIPDKLTKIHKTPAYYVVSVNEVSKAIPMTKYAWKIYADSEFYYLVSDLDSIDIFDGKGIKENGYRVSGTSRSDFEKIEKVLKKNAASGFTAGLSFQQLVKLLPR